MIREADASLSGAGDRTRPTRRAGVRALPVLLTGVVLITLSDQPAAA